MNFEITEDFLIDGKATKIISGSIHYFRIPQSKWAQSLHNLKAMGGNCVETYIPWNVHEPVEGQFNFSGMADIEKFIELATEMGLYIILRPSCYICAEWEYGGLPSWLLKKNIRVRSEQPEFLAAVDAYFAELLPRLAKFQFRHGGNVLMMQIENEYGSYGDDKEYLRANKKMMEKYGIDVPLFTSDGGWEAALEAGNLIDDGVLATVNFGSNAKDNFAALTAINEKKGVKRPLMCMEFWDGWFSAWGKVADLPTPEQVAHEFSEVVKRGSINLYMFHGGTNFGFMNGANKSLQEGYAPQATSYDYEAPLNENGNPTPKFFAIRKVIQEMFPDKKLPEPIISPTAQLPTLKNPQKVSLFSVAEDLCDLPVENDYPLTMEALDQDYGYLLYESVAPLATDARTFQIIGASDRAQLYVDHQLVMSQDEKNMGSPVKVDSVVLGKKVQVLVENRGRVNYGPYMVEEDQCKGIRGGVRQDIHFISHWLHFQLPLTNVEKINFDKEEIAGTPTFYRFVVNVEKTADTFLDMRRKGKGVAFVNGINLGRFWEIGPTTSLFVPKEFLRTGENEFIIFETEGHEIKMLEFSKEIIKHE